MTTAVGSTVVGSTSRSPWPIVFPEGHAPRTEHADPAAFGFVLIDKTGTGIHGQCLYVYDESVTAEQFAEMVRGDG